MTRLLKITSIFFVLFLLSTSPLYAAEPLKDPFYTQGQEIKNLPPLYSVQESVDPFSGNLKLVHTDVHLPGNGGLDLTIMRTYDSAVWGRRDVPWVFVGDKPRSPLGIGWSMHMGLVRNPSGTSYDNLYNTVDPVVELPDGSHHMLYKHKTLMNTYISKEYWLYKIYANGVYELILTDGTVYTFQYNANAGYYAWDNTQIAQVTKIQNPAKNATITIAYDKTSGTGIGLGYSYIKTITDSVGRTITFNYDFSKHQLTSIAIGYRTLISYQYVSIAGPAGTFFSLSQAALPEGTSTSGNWGYSYDTTNYEMKTVTSPYGGTITYTFSDVQFKAAPALYLYFSVVTRRTTGGRDIPAGTWTYQYDTGGTGGNITTITAPDSMKEVHKYNAWGNSSYGYVWQVGLPISKQIYSGASVVYSEAFSWGKSAQFISYDDLSSPSWTNGGTALDTEIYVPLMASKAVTRDGKTYTTDYTSYDDYGNPESISETGGTTRSTSTIYWYNTTNNIVANKPATVTVTGNISLPGTFTTSYVYNSAGNITQISRYGVTTGYTYDTSGNLDSITDANGNTTYYDWTYGRVSKKTVPGNLYSITRGINSDGTIASETNGRGYRTSYTYDNNFRLLSIDPPVGNTTTFSYATDNSYKKETRGGYYAYQYYDGLGRPSGTKDSKGITTDIVYTAYGPKDRTSSNIGDTEYYDLFNRPESVVHQDTTKVTYTYSGNSVTVTDEALNKTYLTYVAFGNPDEKFLVSVNDALSNTTDYDYNILGSLTKITQGSLTRTFTYDSKNFLTGESHPDRGSITYTRYNLGNIKTKADGLGTTSYFYDALNRLTQIKTATETVTMGYDNADNRTQLDNGAALIDFIYDGDNRLTKKNETIEGKAYSVQYVYDLNDNVTDIYYSSSRRIQYGYNSNNQVTSVSWPEGGVTGITYYTIGSSIGLPESFTYSNGHTTTFSYNTRNLTTRITAGGSFLDLGYGYDSRGNTTTITNNAKNQSLGYDDLNRLTAFNGPWGTGSFTYDAIGNRKTKTVAAASSYDYTNNRLTSVIGAEAASYNYNTDGDLTGITVSGTTYALQYDRFHNLTSYDYNGNPLESYAYDGDGMRVSKTSNSKTIVYHYDQGGKVIAENDANGNLLSDYVYLHGKLVAKVSPPPPSAPANLAAWPAYTAQINLRWDDNADNELGYTVERKMSDGTYEVIATLAPDTTTFVDRGLTPGVAYFYRIKAYNQIGNSAYSNEASAVPVSNPTPDISVAPMTGSFGAVVVGESSVVKTFTVTNTGTDDLTIGSITLTGTNPSDFALSTDNCSARALVPLATCTVAALFKPLSGGPQSANLSISSNDPDTQTLSATLVGTGMYRLTVKKAGLGSGTVTSIPTGISCGTDCEEVYGASDTVTLTAAPDSSSVFGGWSGIECSPTNDCSIAMNANITVTATFNVKPPVACFIGSPTTGIETVTVVFTDCSTGNPTSWFWDFGDGTTSTLQNPTPHIYSTVGSYSVTLTVTNVGGSSPPETKPNYITVQACPNLPVRIAGATPAYYSTLQAAYDAAADGDTIQMRNRNFIEGLNADRAIKVNLEGGYDCGYVSSQGITRLKGMIRTSAGTVVIKNFMLQQ